MPKRDSSLSGPRRPPLLYVLSPRALGDESGQVVPWVLVLMGLFLGVSGLVIDVGHALLVQRQLQVSANAAALAGAQVLTGTGAQTPAAQGYLAMAMSYSSAPGARNALGGGVTVDTPSIVGECLANVTLPCDASDPNAVIVRETAHVQTWFAALLGFKSFTVSASAIGAKGSRPLPLNVAIIIDSTPSMDEQDPSCGSTQMACATNGTVQLVQGLDPTMDHVSLFTFPNILASTASNDTDCNRGTAPSPQLYTFPDASASSLQSVVLNGNPVTYQVTGFSSDFRTSNTAQGLNPDSLLAAALGLGDQTNRCSGIQTSTEYTYYAGAIYAAQAALEAEQALQQGSSQNIIILLSDGNATAYASSPSVGTDANHTIASLVTQASSVQTTFADGQRNYADGSGTYPSWISQCWQGVQAAQAATAAGTTVFTVAYGASTQSSKEGTGEAGLGNCASDVGMGMSPLGGDLTPCQAMQYMSSGWPADKTHFYSDYAGPGGDANCQASPLNSQSNLASIFSAIRIRLTSVRLISGT